MLVNRNRFTADQRALDRIQNQIVDEPLLSEADLGLGRMRVDIHLVKGQLHEEKHDRIRRGRNAIPVGLAHGACDQLVPHHAAIYVEELRVRIRFLLMRPRAEAIDLNISRAAGDLHEILQETLAKELVNPVLQRGHRDHIEQRAPVALKREAHLGVGQGIVGYEPGNVSKLRIVGAQKLPARRHVEKEVPDRDFSPLLPRDGLNRSQRAPLNFDFRSRRRRIGRMAGPENQSGYGSHGRQCLAAEPERCDGIEVFRGLQFAGGVMLEGEDGIVLGHPFAVISHLDQALASGLHCRGDRAGAGIDGILEQLLYHGSRPFHDFPCRDLIGKGLGQDLDLAHGSVFFTATPGNAFTNDQ